MSGKDFGGVGARGEKQTFFFRGRTGSGGRETAGGLTKADLEKEEQLDPQEQWNVQASICPLRQSLICHLGVAEGGVEYDGPKERLSRTFEGVGERSKD